MGLEELEGLVPDESELYVPIRVGGTDGDITEMLLIPITPPG